MITDTVAWLLDETSQIEFKGTDRPTAGGEDSFMGTWQDPDLDASARGRVRSVMSSYTDIDGIPVASDPRLLTEVLRDAWGFTGTVVSDYGAVTFLQLMHRIAGTEGEAAAYALAAGLDIELPSTVCYGGSRCKQIEAGRVDEALVDRALRRVLAQKLELGLLDAGWSPEPLDDGIDFDSIGNRDIARRVAESSIVLLDNPTGLLPLQTSQRIAVIGPCLPGAAPRTRNFLGHRPQGVSNLDPTPAFPFGHGLSYTSFSYDSGSAPPARHSLAPYPSSSSVPPE